MTFKEALKEAILAQLGTELAALAAGAEASRQEATDAENRQEGKYDMRAQLAAYLAAGQAKLASELNEAIIAFRNLPMEALLPTSAITVGALVAMQIKGTGPQHWFLLGPARGGLEVTLGDRSVTVVTPGSPLGRSLLGRRSGDTVDGQRRIIAVE